MAQSDLVNGSTANIAIYERAIQYIPKAVCNQERHLGGAAGGAALLPC